MQNQQTLTFQQTQALAARIRQVSPTPLTQRQALRQAINLVQQARACDQLLQDFHREQEQGQQPNQ